MLGDNYHGQDLSTMAFQEHRVWPIKFGHKQKVMGPKFEGMEMKISGEEAEKSEDSQERLFRASFCGVEW